MFMRHQKDGRFHPSFRQMFVLHGKACIRLNPVFAAASGSENAANPVLRGASVAKKNRLGQINPV
jgi:hypothetical protein